jgi:DNA-binding MarR family transcriptional regulator
MEYHETTQLQELIREYLDHAMHRSQHRIFRRSRETGLSFSQMAILRRLNWHGDATAGDLSDFLEVSKAALSQAVDKLVDLGLVGRRESEEDRRVKIHGITDKGRRLIDEVHADRYGWLPEELEQLNEEDRRLVGRAFHALMRTKEKTT